MKRAILFVLTLTSAIMAGAQPKALFYMVDRPNSVKSFAEHADKIDILVPAWYGIDGNGLMWGGPDPSVLQIAAQHHVPVMPIVATTGKPICTNSSQLRRREGPLSTRFSTSAKRMGTVAFRSTSKM